MFLVPYISLYAVLAGWKLGDFLWKWFCVIESITLLRVRSVYWFCLILSIDVDRELFDFDRLEVCRSGIFS